MSCFWTDLVGATQTGCDVGPLRPIISSTALMGATAPTMSEAVSFYLANADVETMRFFAFSTGNEAGDAGDAQETRNITAALGFLSATATFGVPSFDVPVGFAPASGKYDVPLDGLGLPVYDELVVSASLSVVSDVLVLEWGCGNTVVSVSNLPGTAYTISVSSPGVLQFNVVSDYSGSFGAIGVRALRVQGTITGDGGTTATVDFWATGGYDGCF